MIAVARRSYRPNVQDQVSGVQFNVYFWTLVAGKNVDDEDTLSFRAGFSYLLSDMLDLAEVTSLEDEVPDVDVCLDGPRVLISQFHCNVDDKEEVRSEPFCSLFSTFEPDTSEAEKQK